MLFDQTATFNLHTVFKLTFNCYPFHLKEELFYQNKAKTILISFITNVIIYYYCYFGYFYQIVSSK